MYRSAPSLSYKVSVIFHVFVSFSFIVFVSEKCVSAGFQYDLINMATCGTSKSCFVFPTGCKQTQDCDAIVTWAQDLSQNNIHFEIGGKRSGTTDKWFAVGMSDDQVMVSFFSNFY